MEYEIHCSGNGVHHSIKFTYFIESAIFGRERKNPMEKNVEIESESENEVLKNLGSKHLSIFLSFFICSITDPYSTLLKYQT